MTRESVCFGSVSGCGYFNDEEVIYWIPLPKLPAVEGCPAPMLPNCGTKPRQSAEAEEEK